MKRAQDGVIIAKICNGERDRFRELVEAYQGQVFAIAFAGLRDRALAEEAVQEAFIRAYINLRGLRKPEKFGPWLCAITRRVVLLLLRRERGSGRATGEMGVKCGESTSERSFATTSVARSTVISAARSTTRLDDEKMEPAEEVHQREVSAILLETLERLPHHLAETLTVFYIQEKSVSETAELLGVSEATVKTRLHRGRELMRRPLERILDEELRQLRPSRNLTPGVMGMLPGLTMKTGWSAGLSSVVILFLGSQIVMFGGMVWLGIHLFEKSFKNPKDYRVTLYRGSLLKMIPIIILAFSSGIILQKYIGQQGLFTALGIFCLFFGIINLPRDLKIWKVGNPLFLLRSLILNSIGIFYVLIPFIPQLKEFQMLPFLGFGLTGLLAMKGKIMRQDISLFLRAIKQELPAAEDGIQPPEFSAILQKRFACFLGQEMLFFGDEYFADGSWGLGLSPVINYRFFPRSWRSFSKIWIDRQGNFKASLSQEDLNELERIEKRKVENDEIAAMELRVAGAVRASAMFFSQGKLEQARGALCVLTDSEIFKNGTFRKTPFARFWFVWSIVLLSAMLVIIILEKFFHF